jgi:hypothetical protein
MAAEIPWMVTLSIELGKLKKEKSVVSKSG